MSKEKKHWHETETYKLLKRYELATHQRQIRYALSSLGKAYLLSDFDGSIEHLEKVAYGKERYRGVGGSARNGVMLAIQWTAENPESWAKVSDGLPKPGQSVLALLKERQTRIGVGDNKEMWPRNPHHYIVAKIELQFKTNKPMWVNGWDNELIERTNLAVTHWMPLPKPSEQEQV